MINTISYLLCIGLHFLNLQLCPTLGFLLARVVDPFSPGPAWNHSYHCSSSRKARPNLSRRSFVSAEICSLNISTFRAARPRGMARKTDCQSDHHWHRPYISSDPETPSKGCFRKLAMTRPNMPQGEHTARCRHKRVTFSNYHQKSVIYLTLYLNDHRLSISTCLGCHEIPSYQSPPPVLTLQS